MNAVRVRVVAIKENPDMQYAVDHPPNTRHAPTMVSVVIPARNASGTIDVQMAALAQQTYEGAWEVVVADNGSDDDTNAKVRAWTNRIPTLRIVDASDRPGPNHARNVGAREARGDFLLFCDADDEASPDWMQEMARAASEYDLVGGAIDIVRLNDVSIQQWVEPIQADRLPRVLDFLPYSMSANLGVWKEVMLELGGWNELFDRPAGDDVDLCWRAQLNSYKLGFAPGAVIHYRYRSDLSVMARQHFSYGAAEPRLYKAFGKHGFRRPSWRAVVAEYIFLLVRTPLLFTRKHRRAAWIRRAAHLAGRVSGSVRERVIFL